MNERSKKGDEKKLGFPCKKPRLKNIDSTRLKSNENRSGNLISRCFERKEKEKKNKQERGYIRSTQNFLLFPLVSSSNEAECRNCEIYSRYKRDRSSHTVS